MNDDTGEFTFTSEAETAIRRGILQQVKDRVYSGPGVHYEMPPIHGQPPRGSFRIPRDFFAALGHGNLELGGAVVAHMFSVEHGDDVTIVPPDVIRDLGHGSERAGRKVLEKFVQRVRHGARDAVILEHDGLQHDDGSHGWSVA
jgi:hypothetical protein